MSSNIIRCVLQDSRGMLWVGTADGLNHYDGYSFTTFRKSGSNSNTIRGNFITKLAEDQVGDLWIGYLTGGVSCYNIATGVFRHYSLKDLKEEKNNKTPEVTMLYVDKRNTLWVGVVEGGLYSLDKGSGAWTHHDLVNSKGVPLPSSGHKDYNTVFGANEDGDNMWLATAAGLYYFQPSLGELQLIKEKAQNTPGEYLDLMLSIFREGNTLWMGTWSGGLASYDVRKKEWHRYKYDRYSPTTNVISGLLPSQSDTIDLISDDRGLGYFDKRAKKFSFPSDGSRLKAGDYKAIYTDRTGNVWVASNKALFKLFKVSPKFNFTPLRSAGKGNENNYTIHAAFENDSVALFGSSYGHGLAVMDKRTGRKWDVSFDELPMEERKLQVTDILQDAAGTIWVLTRDHLFYLDKNRRQLKKRTQPPIYWNKESNYFFRIREDKSGRLWIASLRGGVFVYDSRIDVFIHHFSIESEGRQHIPSNYVHALFIDKGNNIWIGGAKGFLGKVNAKNASVEVYSTYFPDVNVNANTVYDIIGSDPHDLWVGTDAGLMRYEVRGDQLVFKKNYTSENGIGSDIVKSIARSKDNNIWCLTETSLCRINPATEIAANYGFADGLVNSGIGNRIVLLSDNRMVVGTAGGYYQFDPVYLALLKQTAQVLVSAFNINGVPRYYWNELAANGIVKLKPSDNQFSFEFTNIDFNRTEKQQYAYMMEGMDTGWIRTYNRYAGYGNLKPGKYIFKVRAVSSMDKQDGEIISIPILVSGFFYKTTWFWLIVAGSIFGVMYAVYAIRLRNQKRIYALNNRAELLEKEKAMVMYESLKQHLNPHFLFNSLTSLGSLIYIDQKLAANFLQGLSRIYRYILLHRDKELVALSDEIRFCETYIQLQQTRFGDAFQVHLRVEENFHDLRIAPVTLQNLVENAIKHNIVTEEEPLVMEIFVNEFNQLIVQNNLNKKEFVETSNGQGLESLNTLYQHLAGKRIEIVETAGHFIVKVPLL
ncbi:histidine kinase [Terrimonas sp. NA20]|uniref:Histidine kinase n=1 Tax=Terrimonas ginsenosidimutans TaxID=2908004 RepID=A0ABS9KM11_9BACT|nr:two-component regulator propeller domain-containing protein [Terrimonas ginsenosidimutans]MCG2613357.1 histidine kinase [Terrimonas ginsenosidimutans]